MVLGLGTGMEVMEPAELRDAVRARSGEILALNGLP
jgi:hypothetical protein